MSELETLEIGKLHQEGKEGELYSMRSRLGFLFVGLAYEATQTGW